MRRHLPLVRGLSSAPSEPRELPREEPRELPRKAIAAALAIADTGDGSEALVFARQLAEALVALGHPSALLLVGYDRAPSLPATLRERLAPFTARASAVADVALPDGFAILVGSAALAAFAAPLSVLIGVGRPLSAWPSELRRLRACCGLELANPDDAIARALAERLLTGGFLR